MLFRRISHRIARQFTVFVFLLLTVNGIVFLAADVQNMQRQTGYRLASTAEQVLDHTRFTRTGVDVQLQPFLREKVRVVNAFGDVLYEGSLFRDVPFVLGRGVQRVGVQGEQYAVATLPIEQNGQLIGFVQVGEVERFRLGDLPPRALLYALISALVSALTYGVGLFFARRSLRPAEEMVGRLEQFTQDASHELRTPLATLSSSLDLALRTERHREGLLSAKEDVRELSVLIERLLELARLDRHLLRTQRLDLSSLAHATAEEFSAAAAAKRVEIRTSIVPEVRANGDPTLIRQVLRNLVGNAVKFTRPEGGWVSIGLTRKELVVEDSGIGMAPEVTGRIFDRFYQAEAARSAGGFGLGLALVKRICDLHGWPVTVESEEGKGTVFRVKFA